MSNGAVEALKPVVEELISIFEPVIDKASRFEWQIMRDGIVPVVIVGALRRQFDSLRAILVLANGGFEDKGVALLRPACEEYLWLKYMKSLRPEQRECVVRAKSQLEVQDSVTAQREDAGADRMRAMGFPDSFIERTSRNADEAQNEIETLAKALGWPAGKRGKRALPSTWYLARITGEESLYKLIFHASSRTVHFTVSELLRLAWGTSSEIRVSNVMMSSYWREFVLYWGWRLFFFTFVEVGELLDGSPFALPDMDSHAESRFGALSIPFSKCGPVPIITPQEMNLHLSGKQIEDIFGGADKKAEATEQQ